MLRHLSVEPSLHLVEVGISVEAWSHGISKLAMMSGIDKPSALVAHKAVHIMHKPLSVLLVLQDTRMVAPSLGTVNSIKDLLAFYQLFVEPTGI